MKKFILFLFVSVSTMSFAQISKVAIVEHFTNTRCGVCGYKNPAMFEVLESYPEVIHIAYHPSSPYSSCIFSQHNPSENDERTNYYNVYGATPRVLLNGKELPPQTPMVKEEDLDEATDEMSNYNITVSQMELGANEMNVMVKVRKISEDAESNLDLYVGLAENEINYSAPNGEDVHHHVFRLKLGEEEISSMTVDEVLEFNYTYEFHSQWQSEKMFVYAILNSGSKMVLQSGKSQLAGELTGIENQLVRDGLLNIGPNPTTGTLFISNSSDVRFDDLNIFNIYGQLVLSQDFNDVVNVESLKSGLYIVQMQTINGEKVQMKFQKN